MSELIRAVETAGLGACRQMWCRIGRLGLVLGLFGSVWSVSAGVSAQNLEPLTNVQQVAAGVGHTCALMNSGEVYCWGSNQYGQLGDGSTTQRLTPVAVSALSGATAIAAGAGYTCALVAGGAVYCWGDNFHGQLGDGSTTRRLTPVTVGGLYGTTTIAAGRSHACVVVASAAVRCWGANGFGQLGDGTAGIRPFPAPVLIQINLNLFSNGFETP